MSIIVDNRKIRPTQKIAKYLGVKRIERKYLCIHMSTFWHYTTYTPFPNEITVKQNYYDPRGFSHFDILNKFVKYMQRPLNYVIYKK